MTLEVEGLKVGPVPLTFCLLPGSGLDGQASLAAASWVRKEEKSHILWWLYPLGSLPETLATEQTVEPSGDRGRDLGPAYPAQMRHRSSEKCSGKPGGVSEPRLQLKGPGERSQKGRAWEDSPVSTWVIGQHSPAASSYAFLSHWAGRESEGRAQNHPPDARKSTPRGARWS